MYTLSQIKSLRYGLDFEPKVNGYTLKQIWEIEKHDELTNDSLNDFYSDVLDMFNNYLICFDMDVLNLR